MGASAPLGGTGEPGRVSLQGCPPLASSLILAGWREGSSSQIFCQAKIVGYDATDLTMQHPLGNLELELAFSCVVGESRDRVVLTTADTSCSEPK